MQKKTHLTVWYWESSFKGVMSFAILNKYLKLQPLSETLQLCQKYVEYCIEKTSLVIPFIITTQFFANLCCLTVHFHGKNCHFNESIKDYTEHISIHPSMQRICIAAFIFNHDLTVKYSALFEIWGTVTGDVAIFFFFLPYNAWSFYMKYKVWSLHVLTNTCNTLFPFSFNKLYLLAIIFIDHPVHVDRLASINCIQHCKPACRKPSSCLRSVKTDQNKNIHLIKNKWHVFNLNMKEYFGIK